MIIKLVSHKPYPEFEVYEENKMVIHIKIDMETQALRITCLDSRRVFFIADEEVKKSKTTTLLNEYSQQLGFLVKNKTDVNTGTIEIEGKQYTYRLNDGLSKEIHLFEYNNYQPIISCKIESGQLLLPHEDYISHLLFSLLWYKFLNKEQAAFVQFAEA